jgi:hypothetical protein
MPDETECLERDYLAQQVAKANQAALEARVHFDSAPRGLEQVEPYAETLGRARVAQHEATLALEEHRKRHGC